MDFFFFVFSVEVPEEEKKREKLIEELFQTEETYLDNLKLVYEVGGIYNLTFIDVVLTKRHVYISPKFNNSSAEVNKKLFVCFLSDPGDPQ